MLASNSLFGTSDTRPKIKRSGSTVLQWNENEPDPDGDVTLVVSPPRTPHRYKTLSETNVSTKGFSFATAVQPATTTPSAATGSASGSLFGPPPTSQPAGNARAGETIFGNAQSFNECVKQDISKLRIRVSSKVLMLASAYFRRMFSTQWRECQELNANGSVELEIPDTDPKAFLIILNIIHLRRRCVPQSVDLDTLTELAVLTDYFQCHDALRPYPTSWRGWLKGTIPQVLCNDLVKWICISWVFDYDDIFTKVTQTAQRHSTNHIDCLDLPIPESVSNTINTSRVTALSEIFAALKERQSQLDGEATMCSYMCDSMHLGTLFKSMTKSGLSMHEIAPYPGLDVECVIRKISDFQSPSGYRCPRQTAFMSPPILQCSVLGETVLPRMNTTKLTLQGLVLGWLD